MELDCRLLDTDCSVETDISLVSSLKAIENLSENGQRKNSILRLRNEPESSLERARELLTALNLLGWVSRHLTYGTPKNGCLA